jgi:hypothetical protein
MKGRCNKYPECGIAMHIVENTFARQSNDYVSIYFPDEKRKEDAMAT